MKRRERGHEEKRKRRRTSIDPIANFSSFNTGNFTFPLSHLSFSLSSFSLFIHRIRFLSTFLSLSLSLFLFPPYQHGNHFNHAAPFCPFFLVTRQHTKISPGHRDTHGCVIVCIGGIRPSLEGREAQAKARAVEQREGAFQLMIK